MSQGAPRVILSEANKAQIFPGFKGGAVAVVVDTERGPVDDFTSQSTPEGYVDRYGKPNPLKYGISSYSALNAIQKCSNVKVIRVDRGQLYGSLLARSKVAAQRDIDDFGFNLEVPSIDPVIKPSGSLSKADIEAFQFPKYERSRITASFGPVISLTEKPVAGASKIYVDSLAQIQVGRQITFKDTTGLESDQYPLYRLYTVQGKAQQTVTQDYIEINQDLVSVSYDTPVSKVEQLPTSFSGVTSVTEASAPNAITLKVSGTTSAIIGDKFKVNGVATIHTISAVTDDGGDKVLEFTPALAPGLPLGEVLQRVVPSAFPYSTAVLAKEVVAGSLRRIRVNNNDPIAEGDSIRINGVDYSVVAKLSIDNLLNEVTLAEEYISQTNDNIGAEVFNVVAGDTEYRDAFLAYPADPGDFSKNISLAITPHAYYADAFNLEVYENGKLVDKHEVSRKHRFNGFGQQMYLETVVNNASKRIRVKDNLNMVDENGEPTMPLYTTFYIRQQEPTKNYTQLTTTLETLRDGDNLIRVAPEAIEKVNISSKIKVGNYEYVISNIRASSTGGPLDVIVLESGLKLDMDSLPKASRFLPIGTALYQQLDLQQTEKVKTNGAIVSGQIYSVTINGLPITYTAQVADNETTVATALANAIEASAQGAVVSASVKTFLTEVWLEVKAQTPGNPFTIAVSANLTKTTQQANVRRWTHAQAERVTDAIVPNLELNKLVTMAEGKFYIRDAGANRFSGGTDGNLPTVGQYIQAAQKAFGNKERVDVIAIIDGGIAFPAYQKALDAIAASRKDCITFLSPSFESQANPDIEQGVVKYRRDLALDSSYSALFTPWIQVYDVYNDFPVWVPVESDAAGTFAYNGEFGELWHPVAGWANGKINRALVVGQEYSETQRGVLYDAGINPVKVDAKGRRAIFGQKTLQIENSPTNRINVRASLIVIGRSLAAYLEEQVFTVNDDNNRRRHKLNADTFMENLKRRGYVYEFKNQCDEDNNSAQVIEEAELYIDVYVKVTRLAEYAHGRVTLTSYGASFELVQA